MIGRRHDGVRPQVALALLALANGGATLARALDTMNRDYHEFESNFEPRFEHMGGRAAIGQGVAKKKNQ